MNWKGAPAKADVFLGKRIMEVRLQQDMTQMQLGKKIKEYWQKVDKFEKGAFVPAPKIELIGEAFGSQIPKKLIRKIVNSRKLESEEGEDQQERLIELYTEAFEQFDEE